MLTQAGRRKTDKPDSERPVTPAEPETPTLPPVSTLLLERRTSGLPTSTNELQPLATSTQLQRRNSGLPTSTNELQPLATSTQAPTVADYDSQATRLDFGELPLVIDEEEEDPDKTTELFAKPLPLKKKSL